MAQNYRTFYQNALQDLFLKRVEDRRQETFVVEVACFDCDRVVPFTVQSLEMHPTWHPVNWTYYKMRNDSTPVFQCDKCNGQRALARLERLVGHQAKLSKRHIKTELESIIKECFSYH